MLRSPRPHQSRCGWPTPTANLGERRGLPEGVDIRVFLPRPLAVYSLLDLKMDVNAPVERTDPQPAYKPSHCTGFLPMLQSSVRRSSLRILVKPPTDADLNCTRIPVPLGRNVTRA